MTLNERIDALVNLGAHLQSGDPAWQAAKEKAEQENAWFTQTFIEQSVDAIIHNFLQRDALQTLAQRYRLPQQNDHPAKVGLVLAGNIPLVGFHDLLCCFLVGHHAVLKLSSKDSILPKYIVAFLQAATGAETFFTIAENLRGCDAYIATGGNNTARYFEYYFAPYPHIIRRNRTSVAVLEGTETAAELSALADDVHSYFGLGCRNVTKLYVPQGYDFIPLLDAFKKYNPLINHNKFKNNYDYHLAVHLLNGKKYMSTEALLLIEDEALFSPIAQLNYEFYADADAVAQQLTDNESVQAVVGRRFVPFGQAQCPALDTFADGVDTIAFLKNLGQPAELRRP